MKTYKTELVGLVSALGLLSLLAFASSAHAEDGGKDTFEGRGPGMPMAALTSERAAERLGLDETQVQSIKNILEAAKPEFQALHDRVQAEIEAVLTTEQLAMLEQAQQRQRGGRGGREGRDGRAAREGGETTE